MDPHPVESPRLLDTFSVAARLLVSERAVRRYVAAGLLPSIVLPGGDRRVTVPDLIRFIEARRVGADDATIGPTDPDAAGAIVGGVAMA